VLRLLARGLTNKQIATDLTISSKTVSNHVEHIYAKIDASTRARAGLFAMQHGLLPEEQFATSIPVEKMSQTPHAIPPPAIYGHPRWQSTADAKEESR